MLFKLLDGVLKKELQMVVGNHAHQAQIVFHIGLSKTHGVRTGEIMDLEKLKEELVGLIAMELLL